MLELWGFEDGCIFDADSVTFDTYRAGAKYLERVPGTQYDFTATECGCSRNLFVAVGV